MPIYAYRCSECGFSKDVLQKLSDPVLTECPGCGKPGFKKQVTAAGFQLKGSGWYATDFKGVPTQKPATGEEPAKEAAQSDASDAKAAETKPAEKSDSTASAANTQKTTSGSTPA